MSGLTSPYIFNTYIEPLFLKRIISPFPGELLFATYWPKPVTLYVTNGQAFFRSKPYNSKSCQLRENPGFFPKFFNKCWCNSLIYRSFSNKENYITVFVPKLDLLKVNIVDICELHESLWTLTYICHECFCKDYRVHGYVSSTYQFPEINI